jgi:dUTP pyrophosphatase
MLPFRYALKILPRSGLAAKGISVANSPGLVDANYRGPVKVLLVNGTDEPFMVRPGDRIAQMLVERVEVVQWELVDQLPPSEREEAGFGSSGVK